MVDKLKKTPIFEEACGMLPPELVPILEELVTHYRFASLKQHGKAFASPKVLAELLLLGWRVVADPIDQVNLQPRTPSH